ncbi:bifunctional homocysteine S-methyltransferase/methylenetetrahydrofolate reductase [Shimazuella sp. AN120528]|uniref:bifunctional homocysteine S-methyltransferase/methylenetetrahydrofolate reductase n=1 Tax=Shimazuella soli TaxID=1892854 RepID=UPI001F0DE442|nr:bifunctional homocysteine S-methyltransferase/methylenetetrahydrofolate reductase [Shimazuella soli]MCH5585429.1 bifunctional homocysteine S-methyltransferase/methylenetetrahydrofolate reductase [Shimazuella soli]
MKDHILLGDGAMATYLFQQGISVHTCQEELNLSEPTLIENVHRKYVKAGSMMIETNTYGANRERLSRYGLENKVAKINREAVTIAKTAAGEDAYVFGSIGSILAGRVMEYDPEEYLDLFEEQATALLYGGVDGILLETFLDVHELKLAVKAIRNLTDLPLFAQFSLIEVGRTRDAYSLSEAFKEIAEKVDGVGLNCRLGPVETLRSLEKSIVPESLLLSAFPNAGRLGITDGEVKYKSHPAYFAEISKLMISQGVNLIGGCCGTAPEHIAQMKDIVENVKPVKRINPSIDEFSINHTRHVLVHRQNQDSILSKVKQKRTIICEFDTPKDLDTTEFLVGAQKLHEAGVDSITMADNALATTRMSNLALGAILKSQLGLNPLLHIACRDRNLIGQQSHLMGLHALGIDQILVITGDPSRIGDLPGASSIYDVTSFELIRMVKQLNQGLSFSGKRLNQTANFIVGTAFNPHVRKIEKAVERLEKKIEAGADFVMTQPLYDHQSIHRLYEATKHIPIPIFIGIMPITSYRNALFLHNEIPGIKITDHVLAQMEKTPEPEKARQLGIDITKDLLDGAMEKFRGIYLITPFSFWQMSVELTHYIRDQDKQLKKVIP